MAFWWVNHKKSWKAETSRGALWSPLRKANGAEYHAYANMALARAGDVIFSYANGRIGHIGIVDGEATLAPKPDYADNTPWSDEGWLLPVSFSALQKPINPKEHLNVIERLRPEKHSPILANGDGTMNYLSAISNDFGSALAHIANIDPDRLRTSTAKDPVLRDLDRIAADPTVTATVRLQLASARIGQGSFRKRVLAMEPMCRITGVAIPNLLRASHIKPWRDSTNEERLDGANGLMLAPHVDLLFDQHLISFTDEGRLLISPELDRSVIERWHISNSATSTPFNARQQHYLALHRSRLQESGNLRQERRQRPSPPHSPNS